MMLCARWAEHDENVDTSDGAGTRSVYRTPAAIEKSKAEVANLLALVALLAFGVAFVAAWSVLGDSAFAVKFENGDVTPGTDVATAQIAAWITFGALVFGVASVVAAAALRTTRVVTAVVILTIITAPFYVPVGLLVYGLAF
jgi:hypothetical protein